MPRTPSINKNACPGFDTVAQALDHAHEYSKKEMGDRYIIRSGDVFFSSNTGNVQWYETLITIVHHGRRLTNAEVKEYLKKPVFYL